MNQDSPGPVIDTPAHAGVIWISGYSAAGKTSVGRKLEFKLRADGLRTLYLDGDDLRAILGHRWGYERAQRIELARVYFRLCSHLAAQGLTVVIAAVAMYDEVRIWLRANVPHALEVYLRVPESERHARDARTKAIYQANPDLEALYDPPSAPDLVIDNHGDIDPEQAAETIRQFYYRSHGHLSDRGRSEHWRHYYQAAQPPQEPSPFARTLPDRFAPTSRLLEVGCGNGRDAAWFARHGHRVTALDRCPAAIEAAQARHADAGIDFQATDLARWVADHPDRRFDIVYSRFVLHAMTPSEEAEFLTAAATCLDPGGRLYLECRSINDPLARQGEVLSPTERIAGHYRRFIVLDELRARLEQANFQILSAQEDTGFAPFQNEDPVVIRIEAMRPRENRDGP